MNEEVHITPEMLKGDTEDEAMLGKLMLSKEEWGLLCDILSSDIEAARGAPDPTPTTLVSRGRTFVIENPDGASVLAEAEELLERLEALRDEAQVAPIGGAQGEFTQATLLALSEIAGDHGLIRHRVWETLGVIGMARAVIQVRNEVFELGFKAGVESVSGT